MAAAIPGPSVPGAAIPGEAVPGWPEIKPALPDLLPLAGQPHALWALGPPFTRWVPGQPE